MARLTARSVGAVLAAIVVSACGSTVAQQPSALGGPAFGSGLSPSTAQTTGNPTLGGVARGRASGLGAGPAGPGGGPTSTNGISQPGAAGSGQGSGTSTARGANVHTKGLTATSITIGFSYTSNPVAANAAIGAAGITNGDERADVAILVNQINKRGGIHGRAVKVLYHPIDITSSSTAASQAQAECTYWTQDNSVFAVVSTSPQGEGAKDCLMKAGVPYISSYFLFTDDKSAGRQMSMELEGLNFDDYGRAVIDAFDHGGWYGGWDTNAGQPGSAQVKTGIIVGSSSVIDRVLKTIILPGMRGAGHEPAPADVIRFTADGGASQVSGAVLRLRSDNVTHVFIADDLGSNTLLFANQANAQHYFPRLGGGSGNAFQALLDAGDVQEASIHGAVGAGWSPVIDLPFSTPHNELTPAFHSCMRLMASGEQTFKDANAASTAAGHCDEFAVLGAALDRTPALSVPAFVSAIGALGSTVQPAQVMSFRFAADRHAPTAGFYVMTFDSNSHTMRYVGAMRAIP